MKKNLIVMVTLVASMAAIMGLSSFTIGVQKGHGIASDVHTHVSCQGKHCTYTVGCNCAGFSPKTNGDVWEQSYCKRCGHHKSYHK